MDFLNFFKNAKKNIVIFGINSLMHYIENSGEMFADLLILNKELEVKIIYESDLESFYQALSLDSEVLNSVESFYDLITIHRNRVVGSLKHPLNKTSGILNDFNMKMKHYVRTKHNKEFIDNIKNRISIYQLNLRFPFNAILADNDLWYTVITNILPSASDYVKVMSDSSLYKQAKNYITFCIEKTEGKLFLSKSGDELVQMFDRDGQPRGVFPRKSFNRTDYMRHVIWAFIFNRKGKLLLHQRGEGKEVYDGKGLWDKSVGGHIDITDGSSTSAAKRELIEELFIPHRKYSKLFKPYEKDIINYGDWNLHKRNENSYINAFQSLGEHDWILFRVCNSDSEELTIKRESIRRISNEDGSLSFKKSSFISDIFFIISPPEFIDSDEQMKCLLYPSQKKGVAQDHKLVTINELFSLTKKEFQKNEEKRIYTDDLLYFTSHFRIYLQEFSSFVERHFNA